MIAVSPVVCFMRNLEDDVRSPRRVKAAPACTKVFRLEVAEIQEISDILLVSLSNFGRTVVVILEELVSLVEIMIDPKIESVPGLEILNRTCNTVNFHNFTHAFLLSLPSGHPGAMSYFEVFIKASRSSSSFESSPSKYFISSSLMFFIIIFMLSSEGMLDTDMAAWYPESSGLYWTEL